MLDTAPDGQYRLAAPLYARQGWTCVIPLPKGHKHPPPEGFTGADGRDTTDKDIASWSKSVGDWNIGLRAPDGVVGLDVDAYGSKMGDAYLEQMAADLGLPMLPATWKSSARGMGSTGIFWYRVPEGTGRMVGSPCKDVEIIQRHHRYGAVWPSVHPGDATTPAGTRYRWYRPDGKLTDEGDVPTVAELPFLPEEWIAAMLTGGDGRTVSGLSRTEIYAVMNDADARWDRELHGSYAGKLKVVVDRMQEQAGRATRHEAMLRATAIVAGDVVSGALPGRAVNELAEECRRMYEVPTVAGKAAKEWRGAKEADFWSQIGGALERYEDEWAERLQPEIEVNELAQRIAEMAEAEEIIAENPRDDGGEASPTPIPETVQPVIDQAEAAGEVTESTETAEPEPVVEAPQEPEIEPERPEPPVKEPGPEAWVDTPLIVTDATERGLGPAIERIEAEVAAMTPDEVEAMVTDVESVASEAIDEDAVKAAFKALADRWVAEGEERKRRATEALQMGLPVADEIVRGPVELGPGDFDRLWREAEALVRSDARLRGPGQIRARVLPHWIDDDWLPEGCVATLTAPPSGGKTAVAVDMAGRIASGMRWFGVPVQRARVLYLAFEADASTENRFAGWIQENRADLEAMETAYGGVLTADRRGLANLYMTGISAALSAEGGLMAVERVVSRVVNEQGEAPGVVFVDTLAASFGGGDENSARDMHAFVDNLQRLRDRWPRMSFVVLHHPTKDSSRYEFSSGRGSGALRGTAQVELSTALVEDVEGVLKVGRTKSRDGKAGVDVYVEGRLEPVVLRGSDGRPLRRASGDPAMTVVFHEIEADEASRMAADRIALEAERQGAVREALEAALDAMEAEGAGAQVDAVRSRAKDLRPDVKFGPVKEVREMVKELKIERRRRATEDSGTVDTT